MLIACWSVKGGSGTTVVSSALALVVARGGGEVVLVDLAGEAPAVLGLPEPAGPGLADWLRADPRPAEPVARLAVPVGSGVSLLHRGEGRLGDSAGGAALLAGLASSPFVVADAGTTPRGPARTVVEAADESLLVLRPCYLAVRRVLAQALRPTGLIVMREPGRSLSAGDLADVIGVPVRAEVEVDPAVARAVDAGLLAARLPRSLERGLRCAA